MVARTPMGSGWAPGTQLASYLLLREIARGGMGEIWLALDRSGGQFERLVVIKRVLQASETDPQHITLFLDEARIAAQLNHPNVAQVFTLGEHEGSHYLVMEYLAGQSLSRVARAGWATLGVFPPANAAQIALGAARGLGYAHRRTSLAGQPLRIVHRDVSPQNVFVTYDGQVKVLDFGIALAEGRMTKTATGLIRGKLQYMAPEQALAGPITSSTDVFALGVVLWELLAGARLYGKADEVGVLRALTQSEEPYPDVREVAPHVDADLAALVARALAREPRARYADGAVFAEALERWAAVHTLAEPLQALMQRVFGEEIAALPSLHEALAATPVSTEEQRVPVTPEQPTRPSAPLRPPREEAGQQGAGKAAAGRSGGVGVGVLLLGAAAAVGAGLLALFVQVERTKADAPVTVIVEARADAGVMPPEGPAVASSHADADAGPPRPGPSPSQPKKAAQGSLSIDTQPWTRVFLGKRLLGETPLIEVPVPAGALRLRLVNESEAIDTVVDVVVKPGQELTKQYRLR